MVIYETDTILICSFSITMFCARFVSKFFSTRHIQQAYFILYTFCDKKIFPSA